MLNICHTLNSSRGKHHINIKNQKTSVLQKNYNMVERSVGKFEHGKFGDSEETILISSENQMKSYGRKAKILF